jgi:hypothetical protein
LRGIDNESKKISNFSCYTSATFLSANVMAEQCVDAVRALVSWAKTIPLTDQHADTMASNAKKWVLLLIIALLAVHQANLVCLFILELMGLE